MKFSKFIENVEIEAILDNAKQSSDRFMYDYVSSLRKDIETKLAETDVADHSKVIDYFRKLVDLNNKTLAAEKMGHTQTPEHKQAYRDWGAADWKRWSKFRGYTDEEIADYEALHDLRFPELRKI